MVFLDNDYFNIKNIFYGRLKNQSVVFKKLAHHSEWEAYDSARLSTSYQNHEKPRFTTFLPCSDQLFISKFRQA